MYTFNEQNTGRCVFAIDALVLGLVSSFQPTNDQGVSQTIVQHLVFDAILSNRFVVLQPGQMLSLLRYLTGQGHCCAFQTFEVLQAGGERVREF